jgi:hypothetical protein
MGLYFIIAASVLFSPHFATQLGEICAFLFRMLSAHLFASGRFRCCVHPTSGQTVCLLFVLLAFDAGRIIHGRLPTKVQTCFYNYVFDWQLFRVGCLGCHASSGVVCSNICD